LEPFLSDVSLFLWHKLMTEYYLFFFLLAEFELV
jgi:hypothetical protein